MVKGPVQLRPTEAAQVGGDDPGPGAQAGGQVAEHPPVQGERVQQDTGHALAGVVVSQAAAVENRVHRTPVRGGVSANMPRVLGPEKLKTRWPRSRGRGAENPNNLVPWRTAGPRSRNVTALIGLDAGIQQFLDHLKVERQLAAATLEAYGRDLGSFARFAGQPRASAAVGQVRNIDILDYLARLTEAALSARSQARRLVALRQLFKYLKTERVIDGNPTEDIDLPRFGRPLPTFLTVAEVDQLLAAPDRRTPRGARDGAMLELLYATGLAGLRAGAPAPGGHQLPGRLPGGLRQGPASSAWCPSARWPWCRCATTSRSVRAEFLTRPGAARCGGGWQRRTRCS